MQQQPSERGQSEGGRDSSADFKGRMTLSPEPGSPLHQDQPNADGSHAATTNGKGPGQNASRSQAIDGSAKKNTDNKNADRKESRKRNKEKPDDSAQTDDGSNNDNGKKQRNGRDGDQEDSFRGNSNRRN